MKGDNWKTPDEFYQFQFLIGSMKVFLSLLYQARHLSFNSL